MHCVNILSRYEDQVNVEEAIRLYERILSTDPDMAEAKMSLNRIRRRQEEDTMKVNCLYSLLINPNYTPNLYKVTVK